MIACLRRWYYQLVLADWLTRLYDTNRKQMTLGELGEIHAERFLLKQGWIILARRYRIKAGEIDLIAVDERTVVFVEVKTRSSSESELPVEAVDLRKQRQISRVASHYNAKHNLTSVSKRFDILSIVWEEGADPDVTHYRSAFDSTE